MGEVAVSSGGGGGGRGTPELMRETRELPRKQDGTIMNDAGDGSGAAVGAATTTTATATTTNNVVRWDKFLPRMVLRVLLVEADDSTRQIICALLRKCSYRVAAVSDGLKAWEVLKGRPHNIDLILTEVELPSISGFALLTLIMEHEICKSIPVIMMSAHDSVSTVYKCMLRGAADFLVKPVRKNELKNLWQHVWRRQASTSGGNGLQEESDCQQKVEATAENNATSNHSSGYMACIKLNRECIEKGSDAQSSCTKPDMEAEGLHMEQVKDLSNSRWTKSPSSDMKAQKFEQYDKTTDQLKTNENEAEGSAMGDVQKEDRNTQEKGMAMGVRWERVNIVNPDLATGDPPREAIDLIGSFDSFPKSSYKRSINCGANKVDHPSPMLDLSLRRSHPSSSVNQISDERHRLKQSDASAFSRYVNKTQPSLPSGSASISNQQKDCETNSNKQLSKNVTEYNSDTHSVPVGDSQRNMVSSHGQAEIQSQFPSLKQGVFPVPVPVRGLRFENQCATYGSVLPPIFCLQPGLSPMQSPGSSGNQEPSSFQANPYYMSNLESGNGTQEHHNLMVDRKASDETENKEGHKMETMDDRGHFSSATDHSTSSGFCNGGTLSRLNSVGSGSNGHVNLVSDGNNAHRSIQREAALNKFRMKRKDRCYEKKVRYESRKKLAEQRPRVKGQFVRQVQISSPSPMEADRECGNSSPG